MEERQSILREKVKKSQPTGTVEFLVAIVLGFQLVLQAFQWIRKRQRNRRSRRDVLF